MGLRRAAWGIAAMAMLVLGCTTTITIQADDLAWTVSCRQVSADDCTGIVDMYLNNLARTYEAVYDESDGTLEVEVSPVCPDFGPLGQPGACWRISAPVHSFRACMIMARRIEPFEGYRFVRIGGDELSGPAVAPPPGSAAC